MKHRHAAGGNRTGMFLLLLLMAILAGCTRTSPLERLKKELSRYPEYSIILEDMKEEGFFSKDYYHRYRYVYATKDPLTDSLTYVTELTDWERVSRREYQNYYPYLGMVLAAKTPDGKVTDTPSPPGYQYVGNPRYGHWRTGPDGTTFWEFYGKYALLRDIFGMFTRPVYYRDWEMWDRDYRPRRRPFFGQRRQYGTEGSYTRKTHKNFFERRVMREQARKQSFAERVKQRTRRSRMSSLRRRSGGFGK